MNKKFMMSMVLIIAATTCAFPLDSVSTTANTIVNIAPSVAPGTLVADLYKQHNAHKGPFFQTKSRALLDKYFTKSLADMIWKDAKTANGEVGALDGDPLYDAQDIEIKNLKIGNAVINGKSATVPVTFRNYDTNKKFVFSLVKQNGVWKIKDINYGGGSSLSKIFS